MHLGAELEYRLRQIIKKLKLICLASINLKHVYIAREHRKDAYALYVKYRIY
jgi:hypothetical protein